LSVEASGTAKWCSRSPEIAAHDPLKSLLTMRWNLCSRSHETRTIVGRLSEKYPEEFGTKQHSIVQRLLRALRKKAAEQLIAQEPLGDATTAIPWPGSVDGSGYVGPDPPTAPLTEQVWKASWPADQSISDRRLQGRHQGNIRRWGNTGGQFAGRM